MALTDKYKKLNRKSETTVNFLELKLNRKQQFFAKLNLSHFCQLHTPRSNLVNCALQDS